MSGVRQFETRWIGWAGVNVSDEVGQIALKKALEEKVCVFSIFTCIFMYIFFMVPFDSHPFTLRNVIVHGFLICM